MRYIIPSLLLALLVGCPKPDDKLDPGICDEGYHPCGPDSQECCLDTTSHDISWTIDTLGLPGSRLNEVSIVNEEDMWVVGEILMLDPDSSFNGTGIEHFNAARWDGSKWTFLHIVHGAMELYDIIYFAPDDIWVTSGLPIHWDGNEWYSFNLWNMGVLGNGEGSVYHMWASSPGNIWFAGYHGAIVHYDGQAFQKFETLVDLRLNDIFGKDENNIWAVGNDSRIGKSIILSFDGNVWSKKKDYTYNQSENIQPRGPYRGIWSFSDSLYVVGGQGLWRESIITADGWLESFPPRILPSGMTLKLFGSGYNDIFHLGQCNTINHYNGETWEKLFPYDCDQIIEVNGMDIKNFTFLAIVGGRYVYKGYR